MREDRCDVLVVGGGLGGVAAALAALRLGRTVILTEASDWLGGQLTTQAVPPDEHPWIEERGCTQTYRRLRDGVRAYYRRNYPLIPEAAANPRLNPGNGRVSRLCHEPRVAVAVLDEMLAPYQASGKLRILYGTSPIAVHTTRDRVDAVTFDGPDPVGVRAPYVIDATELGDLLDLGGVEHVTGAESAADTGEPHALPGPAEPRDQQALSWCFALEHRPGENHIIDRPSDYTFWRDHRADFWPGPQLAWTEVSPSDLRPHHRAIFEHPSDHPDAFGLWEFRRLLDHTNFTDLIDADVSLVNWAHIDYWHGPIIGVPATERDAHLAAARRLSLSMLYWMQTEAPTLDGGTGYPGLRLRPDITGTADGLAKAPYIRESRRIRAEYTITENHVGVAARAPFEGAEEFPDTVGIGSYRIDLHPSTGGPAGPRTYLDVETWPFQIPLGALIPVRVNNLLPAAKNPGTTHITNGCYRLHPIEWNIGEAAGALAAHCLNTGLQPRQVRNTASHLADFQQLLTDLGVELAWPADIRLTKKYY